MTGLIRPGPADPADAAVPSLLETHHRAARAHCAVHDCDALPPAAIAAAGVSLHGAWRRDGDPVGIGGLKGLGRGGWS